AVRGGAAGWGLGWAATCASRPARKPASQARWIGFAEPTTRLRRSISSSANGAVLGMGLSWLTMALSTAHHGTRGSVPMTIASTSAPAAITAQVSSDRRRRRRGVSGADDVDMAGGGRLVLLAVRRRKKNIFFVLRQ